jgi:3-oxoacyl-ACP reductase-like protein
MKAKNVIVASTMAATITIGGTLLGGKSAPASAAASLPAAVQAAAGAAAAAATPERKKDDFLEALGKSSDEEIDVALYQGKTLADIAEESGRSPQAVIDLQVAELTRQLKERLAGGMLPPDVCEAQIRELPEIVARSVYGR